MSEPGPLAESILETLDRGASLTDRVYERLRRGLIVGVWEPGARLSARAIAREMAVSLTPVREAMLRLAKEGALELSEKRTFLAPKLSKGEYGEVLRIRMALEPMAAAIAAERIGGDALDAIEAMNERMAELLRADAFAEAFEADSEFHLAIYDAAGQPLLRSIIASLLLRVGPSRTRLSRDYRKALMGYNHHRRIIAALRAGDAQAARTELAADITDGARLVMATLDD
jgi:DNA-binding GntR family transcriptional regulator